VLEKYAANRDPEVRRAIYKFHERQLSTKPVRGQVDERAFQPHATRPPPVRGAAWKLPSSASLFDEMSRNCGK
jgi:hypothetical protein